MVIWGQDLNFVFVHGIDQAKESSAKLREIWLGALSPRTLSSVSVPFYGRKLIDFVKGARGLPASLTNLNQFAAEFREEVGVGPFVEGQDRDAQNLWIVRALARVSDKRAPLLAERFITRWLKEVHTYLCNHEANQVVNSIVEAEIAKMCEQGPTVVVGHSLGSVVAYNILRARKFSEVRHFVTLGSPLAISAVVRRLPVYPDNDRLTLDGWFNGFDRRDIVALNPLDQSQLGSTCVIDNMDSLVNTTDNRHGITGYLKIDAVASYLVEKLGTLK